ncbi:MAG: CoA-binding protein [Chloroflexi bacterium]|nr:CoA-binding protein [Chloroflexota bacterium]
MTDHPLDPIFHPRAVALVGVPSTGAAGGGGWGFLTSLLEQKFHERHALYPVNPKMEEVEGLKCYPTLLDTPNPVDHVISLVPARAAPGLVDQVIQKKVRSLHFFTAGFSETGDAEMANVEAEMIAKLRAAGVRTIGPNCMGLYVPDNGLAFMNGFPRESGNVMLISQSGANAGDVVQSLARRGVRFSKVISFGNGADLRSYDFFDYAMHDEQTAVVTAYIEGVQDGRKFFEAVKRCAAVKPVILLKGGLTRAGARAAHSHTGSLAGSIEVFDAMARQAGAVRAKDMDELHDLIVACNTSVRRVQGTGVALVSIGGGYGVLASDAIALEGLDVPLMPQATQDALHEFIPVAGTSVNNPIDTMTRKADEMQRLLKIVAQADVVDAVFVNPIFSGPFAAPAPNAQVTPEEAESKANEAARENAQMLERLQHQTGTALVVITRDRGAPPPGTEVFLQECYERGVAVYPSVARAARTVSLIRQWRARRAGLPDILS